MLVRPEDLPDKAVVMGGPSPLHEIHALRLSFENNPPNYIYIFLKIMFK